MTSAGLSCSALPDIPGADHGAVAYELTRERWEKALRVTEIVPP